MKIYLYLVLLLSFTQNVIAQGVSSAKIIGAVMDEKSLPLEFANVLLLNTLDSSLVKGTVTDQNGRFTFEQLSPDKYHILASATGYNKAYSAIFSVDNSVVEIPTLQLEMDVKTLGEIAIVAKKPFIEQEIDRIIVNVENSIVSAGATALEVLERAPGVTVDQQNEQLSLKGKTGVIVQIDGKQTFLSQQEVVNLLRNMPSSNIEKMELILNPSAKFDAAGNSGIINIKMKRNKNLGTNGNVNVGGGYAGYGRGNATVVVNNSSKKVSSFVSVSSTIMKNFRNNRITRTIPFENQITIFDQQTERVTNVRNYNARLGIDLFLTQKTTLGILLSGFYNSLDNPYGQTNAKILNQAFTLQRSFKTDVYNVSKLGNTSYNLNLKHQFNTKGNELSFDADYVNYSGEKNSNLDTHYFTAAGEQDGKPESVRNKMPSVIKIRVAKVDYALPVWIGKFETGIKFTDVKSDNDMAFEVLKENWVHDTTRSNRFTYTERVSAAYLNFGGTLSKKMKFQLGLRSEHTYSLGNSITLKQKQRRSYLNLFPSLFISTQLNTNNAINLSYSRRIDRPNYQSLNPFEFYLDPFNFIKGNPNLKPQYTDSFQLTHVFKGYLNTTFGYSRIKNLIADELPQQIASENKTFLTSDNLDSQDNFSFTTAFPINLTKWWTTQTNFIGVYNYYESYYLGDELKMTQLSWNLNITNQFTIPGGWSAELSGWYNSKGVYALYRTKPMGLVNVGLQKSLLAKKVIVRLNINDIFWTNKFHGRAIYKDIDYDAHSEWPSRQFRLTFSYNFGNQNAKNTRSRSTGSDDVQKRVNGNN